MKPRGIPLPEQADIAFAALENCAVHGLPAPEIGTHGLTTNAVRILHREGRIRSYMFQLSYRVVEILVGPHKGKKTRGHPSPRARHHTVIDMQVRSTNGKVPRNYGARNRQKPSLSRIGENLTPA